MDALAWLRRPPPEPVLLTAPDHPVLRWAVLDGLLAPAGTGELAAVDVLADPAWRAGTLTHVLRGGAVLARASAVWVHTGRHRPDVPQVVVPRGQRLHARDVRVHVHRVPPEDVVALRGVPVTSLTRTGADVARWAPPERARDQLAALLAVGLDLTAVAAHLAQAPGQPRTLPARAVVAALAADVSAPPRSPPGSR